MLTYFHEQGTGSAWTGPGGQAGRGRLFQQRVPDARPHSALTAGVLQVEGPIVPSSQTPHGPRPPLLLT